MIATGERLYQGLCESCAVMAEREADRANPERLRQHAIVALVSDAQRGNFSRISSAFVREIAGQL
jgi:hypothetical protein